MYDGNPVQIHTGRYPMGIEVSNFKWKFEYCVPEERFSEGGGTNLAAICFLPLCLIHVFKEFVLVKFDFVGKWGSTGKRGVKNTRI
jgi:hypothetical protein